MIPDERASRFSSGYLEDGKEVVSFNPKLSLEEWNYLMYCQQIAIDAKQDKVEAKEKLLLDKAAKEKSKRDKEAADKIKAEEKKIKDAKDKQAKNSK